MEQLQNYGDNRQTALCVYCGGRTETRDHVPSRVFLDKPYPTNLPVVPACQSCNESFSMDEEYVACLVESAVVGAAEEDSMRREKVARILRRKPELASRLSQSRAVAYTGTSFRIEEDRARNVVVKLARGHAAFELNEPQLDEAHSITYLPLPSMFSEAREQFETTSWSFIWPEVGSRAMQRIVLGDPEATGWIVVQPERYRYLTCAAGGVIVRMVIGEYLACEVVWR